MKQIKPENPVNINYVNHGNIFGPGNWYIFYCGNCNHQVYGDAKNCEQCGAILQRKKIQQANSADH